jgi:hypothetical protein
MSQRNGRPYLASTLPGLAGKFSHPISCSEGSHNMIIYQIKLSKKQNPEAFANFMREEYFPAIHKGATRVGQVTELALMQSENADTGHEFFWHVGWSGLSSGELRVDDEKVVSKFKSLSATIKRIGSYREVAAWHPR